MNRCERAAVQLTQDRNFFEKELLYCKLTAASAILKGLLHVSFVAVGSCCFLRWFEVCGTLKLPAKGTFLVLFACTKSTKSTPEVCEPLDSGDDSKLCRKKSAKFSGGSCRNRFCLQNGGEKALNRCERVAVQLTQDRYFSKKDCFTASLQWVVADKICDCSLALLRWEVEILLRL